VKINGTNWFEAVRAYNSQFKKEKIEQRSRTGESAQADRVEISPEARKMQAYRDALNELPAVREDLVASLKQKIQAGAYRPNSEKIAAGIIEETRMDKS